MSNPIGPLIRVSSSKRRASGRCAMTVPGRVFNLFGWFVLLVLVNVGVVSPLNGQPPQKGESADRSAATRLTGEAKKEANSEAKPDDRKIRLANYLTGAKFEGNFTVDGKGDAAPKTESYKIESCEYLGEDERYRLKVKIRYGDVDGEFPMDLQVLWSGSTPVITLDSVWIPGLGTFSSRVLIHDGRYAGTWQHDAKGGHLFGRIVPSAPPIEVVPSPEGTR